MPGRERWESKFARLSNGRFSGVVNGPDAASLYGIPWVVHDEGLDQFVCDALHLITDPPDLTEWRALNERVGRATTPVRIGLIGKYVRLVDAYLSVVESLKHAGIHHGADVEIDWTQAGDVEGLPGEHRLRALSLLHIPAPTRPY